MSVYRVVLEAGTVQQSLRVSDAYLMTALRGLKAPTDLITEWNRPAIA